jgi:hypothetical protein
MIRLDVTSGEILAGIEHPSVRAVLPDTSGEVAELSFTYRGITQELRPLSSGEMRYQLGIKLRAATTHPDDAVYAMWRWFPGGARPWATTKAAGAYYEPTETYTAVGIGDPMPGQRYTLRAELDNRVLRVKLDGRCVLIAELHPVCLGLRGGLAGLRTDNASLADVRMWG